MKKDTRVTIQCPLFRRGKKFEGIITGEKTLAALHIAKHGRTYFVKLDGNNKSTQFHESWLAELPAPSTPVKETEPAPTPTSKEGLEDAKFTAGEWKARGTTRGLNGFYVGTDTQNIAQVYSSIPECEANARLIAESKNLFENLTRIIDRIEESNLQDNFPSAYQRAKAILTRINKD